MTTEEQARALTVAAAARFFNAVMGGVPARGGDGAWLRYFHNLSGTKEV